jgi:hypothetical protein
MEIKTASGKSISYSIQYYIDVNTYSHTFVTLNEFKLFCEDINISDGEYNEFVKLYNEYRDDIINDKFIDANNNMVNIYITVHNGKIYSNRFFAGLCYIMRSLKASNDILTDGLLYMVRCSHWYYSLNHEHNELSIDYLKDLEDESKNVYTISVYKDYVKLTRDINGDKVDILKGHKLELKYDYDFVKHHSEKK